MSVVEDVRGQYKISSLPSCALKSAWKLWRRNSTFESQV